MEFGTPKPNTTEELVKTPEEKRKGYEERTAKLAEEKGIDPKDIMKSDVEAERLNKEKYPDTWRNMAESNSDLTMEYFGGNGSLLKSLLKGAINGKEVEIWCDPKNSNDKVGIKYNVIGGLEDGKEIGAERAQKLYREYGSTAMSRSERINKIAKEKSNKE